MTTPTFDVSLVIFDLDGTLLDSSQYASKAIHQGFATLTKQDPSIPTPTEAEITAQIGKPMQEFYRGLLPHDKQDLWQELHRLASIGEHTFLTNGADFLFPRTLEVLSRLRKSGKTLAIASNCSQDYLDAIAEAYDFHLYFNALTCIGAGRDINKEMLVQDLVERFAPDGRAIMVGDRIHDGVAAKSAGIPFVACDYGFGTMQEWAIADAVIHALPELLALLD